MAGFVVMERGAADHAPEGSRVREFVTVRDRFSFPAFLLPAIWFLWHRLWIEAAVVLAAGAALGWLGGLAGLGNVTAFLTLLVGLYVGMEGPALRIAALRRRGWREWGVVEARNAAEAELRYLTETEREQDSREKPAAAPARLPQMQGPARPGAVPAIGLLSYPGGR